MRLRVVLGNLATTQSDALVRATGPRFDGPASDPVLQAAGAAAIADCVELRRLAYPQGLPVSEAVSTSAGDLSARWLIHVSVPLFTIREDREYQLTAAYRSALRVADELGALSLAVQPFGSTAPYWPLDQGIRCTFTALCGTPTGVRDLLLVLKTAAACEAYAEALARR